MGAEFVICGNSLTGYKIGYDALYDVSEDDVVKAGLPEIVRLQQQGYIYVRP
jgi:intracellular sulfur oxidation DsrE/DsrF family protein